MIGYSILGFDTVFTQQVTLQRRKFNKAVFYGDTILDNLHSQNVELSSAEINAIDTEEKQLWRDLYTNYLSNFENKLSSGNIINENIPVTQWRLKRKRKDESKFTTLKTFSKETNQFLDWTAGNNAEYEYAVHAISSSVEGIATYGSAKLDFWGWILTNGTDHYKFDIQLNSGQIPTTTDMKVYDNYTEFPTVNFGKRKYKSGSLETMPLSFNGTEYVAELSVLEDLERFINDGKVKLLKNTKGEIFWVSTFQFSHTYMEQYIGIPFTISFSWMQVGDGKDPFGGGQL